MHAVVAIAGSFSALFGLRRKTKSSMAGGRGKGEREKHYEIAVHWSIEFMETLLANKGLETRSFVRRHSPLD